MVSEGSSKMVTADDRDGAPNKLIKGNNNEIPSSVSSVISNCDLLLEILLRLPVLSLLLFKSVSKHWYSLIISPDFILRHRTQNLNIDPSFGLFIRRTNVLGERIYYNFKSFDSRIPSKKSIRFPFGSKAPLGHVEIGQSCNGLLLCCVYPLKYYVYNQTSRMFKMLPGILCDSRLINGVRMAFDPTKSPHYKVIQTARIHNDFDDDDSDDDEEEEEDSTIQVHTYSSETGDWNVCGDRFPEVSFGGFEEGVYWNEAIHWLTSVFRKKTFHFKLNIENEQPVLTKLELPAIFDGNSHFESKLFVSRGCLLLPGKVHAHSQQLNVFVMRVDNSEWSREFVVDLNNIMMPLPITWRIRSCVWSIVLGEEKEDSSMIIDLLSTVVQYNPVLKTVRTLADLESIGSTRMVSTFGGFQCIASFAEV